MSAGGFANTLRRGLAIVMALLTLGVGVLWADSYRVRPERLPPPPDPDRRDCSLDYFIEFLDAPDPAGLNHTFEIGQRSAASVKSCKGQLSISVATRVPRPTYSCASSSTSWRGFAYRESFSFNYDAETPNDVTKWTEISLPIWPLVALCAIYPPVFLVRGPLRRRRRRKRGQCIACGYDMKGNESGVCSECGATVKGEVYNLPLR